MRSGSESVSAREAPDCSCSGAAIHTSSLSRRAIRSSAASPSAWMPSSLVSRILIFPSPSRGGVGGGGFYPASPGFAQPHRQGGRRRQPPTPGPSPRGGGELGVRSPSVVPPDVRQARQVAVQGLGDGDAAFVVL